LSGLFILYQGFRGR